MRKPPRKRYTTTITIEHHGGDDLSHMLGLEETSQLIAWHEHDGKAPYLRSIGGSRQVKITENADYEPEATYDDALMAWREAERRANG